MSRPSALRERPGYRPPNDADTAVTLDELSRSQRLNDWEKACLRRALLWHEKGRRIPAARRER